MKSLILLAACITVFGFAGSFPPQQEWQSLFNGKDLKGWDTYLGPPSDESGKRISEIPIGLNNDPDHVFTIVEQDGENVIRISGNGWGGISTTKEYENYHLQLQFKWGTLKWKDKKGKKKDSGLLYHAVGKHGADYGSWMRSQEFQVQEGDCGDYWGVAGGIQDVPAKKQAVQRADQTGTADSVVYVYDPAGQLYTFSEKSPVGRHCIKAGNPEKLSGEWNTLELYCHGDTSVHVVNGKTVMVLYHSRQADSGKELPLTKGKLQIQSEGAEVFYKQIKLRPLKSIPQDVLK
ncbi:MAG: hypothetical protein JWM28_2415 [Chitinophagaceae bacterium]|nr:hypothetical protein [Chitinophagaceae bacterium]